MKVKGAMGLILLTLLFTGSSWAQSTPELLTLEESIRIALERNLKLHSAKEEIGRASCRERV